MIDSYSPVTSDTLLIDKDGGWCWFQSPRALQSNNHILIGSVASGQHEDKRRGNIELHIYNILSRSNERIVLHENLELDDHASPGLFIRPDGRLLVAYSKHGTENCIYTRISSESAQCFEQFDPVRIDSPSPTSELTYNNIFMLANESNRMFNMFRGLHGSFKPSFLYSDDLGEHWQLGNIFIDVPSTIKHRPYVLYASNDVDTIHMIYTEGHPRDFDNNLYHIFYNNGSFYRSDGSFVARLNRGLKRPDQGTLIYQGDPQHVPWIVDIVLDRCQNPVCVFSVQYNSANLPVGQGGDDLRYFYSTWNGCQWQNHPLAYGGTRLYSGEDDYTGLVAIEPDDTSVVYISTNSDPQSGAPLISKRDQRRHYEIFHGKTNDQGKTWIWSAITEHSSVDNLRPIRPKLIDRSQSTLYRSLIWLRGNYFAYTDYQQEIVARVWLSTLNSSV